MARRGDEQDSIVQELRGNVPALAVSPHGSEVLQSCLELLPPQKSGFIAQELCGHAAEVAQHAHGREVSLLRFAHHSMLLHLIRVSR